MAIEIISTAGASNANSLASLAEANYYHERRLALDTAWVTSGDTPARLLIMATRVLCAMVVPRKTLRYDRDGKPFYYTSRAWTGEIASSTQSLAFPRKNMFDRYGRALSDSVNPQDIIDATSELAGQLGLEDRTLDNDIAVKGITSIKVETIALSFKEMISAQVLPDAVLNLMPPSWLTDEVFTYAVDEVLFVAI